MTKARRTPPTPTDSSPDEPTATSRRHSVQPTDSTPAPTIPTDPSASDSTEQPTSPSESAETPNDLENLKEAWKEVYEQARRPADPPWEEIEGQFLERMRAYYAEEQQRAFADKIDDCARLAWYERIQRVLAGSNEEADGRMLSAAGIVYRIMADVKAKPVRWLWPGRIPLGMLTILAGDPGEGKSYISLDIAARLSRGAEWPDGTGTVPFGTTILLTLEDPSEYVIKPRLDLLGADSNRIVLVEGLKESGALNLKTHLTRLEGLVEETGASLIVVDPVNSFFPTWRDSYKDTEVRDVLTPLAKMAERKKVVVLGLMHLNKDADKTALYRLLGSVGYVGVARMVLIARRDNMEERRLLGVIKCSVAEPALPISFRIDDGGLLWGETVAQADLQKPTSPEETRVEEACRFIEETLPIGVKTPTKELDRQAYGLGYRGGTWKRAKQKMNVKSEQQEGVSPPLWLSFRQGDV